MTSFIADSDKDSLANTFYDLHDTYARPITMFKSAQQLVISTSQNNNIFFPDAPTNDQVINIQQSGVFNARIKYITEQDVKFFTLGKNDQNTLKIEEGMVRIKLDPTGAAFIKDTQRVNFDGDYFELMTSQRPYGLFGPPKFYTYFLKKIN